MFVCCLSNCEYYVHCWKFNYFVMVFFGLRVCLILWDWCKANKNKSFLLSVVEGEKVKNQRWIFIIHHKFTREHWVLWFLCLLSEFKQFLELNHTLLIADLRVTRCQRSRRCRCRCRTSCTPAASWWPILRVVSWGLRPPGKMDCSHPPGPGSWSSEISANVNIPTQHMMLEQTLLSFLYNTLLILSCFKK